MVQCVAVCCSVLQCVTSCWSALECVGVCCSVCCSVLQCVAVCCSVLQIFKERRAFSALTSCVAVWLQCGGSVLQCVAVCCRPSKKGRNSQPLSVEADPLDVRSVIICTPQVTNHFESLCCRVLQCDAVCCSVM